MMDFKVAVVAQDSVVLRKKENLESTISWIRKAKQEDALLISFPELNITGHAGDPRVFEEAESVPEGRSVELLCKAAKEERIYICSGIVEESRGLYYNTSFLIGPEGYIGKQRKTHLSQDEYFYFKAGLNLPVFDLPFARIGIIICFDNFFPEITCSLAVKGAEILLSVHADRFGKWPESTEARQKKVEDTKKKWTMRYQCRAKDASCYEVICNAAGQAAIHLNDVESNHAGGCMVVDPNGNIVAESGSKDIEEEMIVVPLYGRLIAERRREKNSYLKHRRPEVFGILSQPIE